jgi:EF-P beta-lysylation protein EpmB
LNTPAASERDTVAGPGDGASAAPGAEPGWRRLLAEAIRDPDELWRALELPPAALPAARASAKLFPLLVPRGFAALMRRGDLADPLLRQVVPLADEAEAPPGFVADPLGESSCSPTPGLLRKYRGRALLVATGACAVHCRYCFRRHFPYDELPRGRRWWEPALAELAADPESRELILSGGDPLTLPDAQLAELAAAAARIPQLTRLRVHTRLPVVLPERVDAALCRWLVSTRLSPVVVIHANHARELSPAVVEACRRLREAGVQLLNQSVLLRGVNDDEGTLAELSERLFAAGVLPYYLHALDRVVGAAHFLVDDRRAAELARALAARLPGYLVPRMVREEPGADNKTPLIW